MALFTAGDQFFSLPLAEEQEKFEVWMPKEKIWDRFNTLSHIAVLEGEEREVFFARAKLNRLFADIAQRTYKIVMDALDSPDVESRDGNVAVHGTTFVVWTTPIPGEGREGLTEVEKP